MLLKRLFLLIVLTGWASPAFAAAIEEVTWPTYYPSPFGNYRQLQTTNRTGLTTGVGDVSMATGAGVTVGIGIAAPTYLLEVRNAAAGNNHTAAFVNGADYGVLAGSWGANTYGSIQAFRLGAANNGVLVLNPNDSHVGIGPGSTDLNYTLHVAGTIGIRRGVNTGELKVEFSGGSYYAVFAPNN